MKNLIKYLLSVMIVLLSSNVLISQLQVSTSEKTGPIPQDRYSVLYQQPGAAYGGQASQDFEPAYNVYDCQGADDFIIHTGYVWNIEAVAAIGSGSGTITLANVLIYADAVGIPAATATTAFMGLPCINFGNYLLIDMPGGLQLVPGHYWISVQDASPYTTDGQWFWAKGGPIRNAVSCWRNPGNGFGTGAVNWTPMPALGYNTDFCFTLYGTFTTSIPVCDYRIDLYSLESTGWHGSRLDVMAGGVYMPGMVGITLVDGYGPESHTFTVPDGEEITTLFYYNSEPCLPYYYVYNPLGNEVYYVLPNCNPIIAAGQLLADCPQFGNVNGYVYDCNNIAVPGAAINAQAGPSTVTDNNGYYYLAALVSGNQDITCSKQGYNSVTFDVIVLPDQTVAQDFTLTVPVMEIKPSSLDEILLPTDMSTADLIMTNSGCGPLGWQASVNYITGICDYSIALYDSQGDGWNGCTLDIKVNGTIISNVKLLSGPGPESFNIPVTYGDEITTSFIPDQKIDEPFYFIYNNNGNQAWYSPPNASGPADIQSGQLTVNAGCDNWLTLDDYAYTVPVHPLGGSLSLPVHFDAGKAGTSGGVTGEIYKAEIVFTSVPDVGTITIPVSLTIADPDMAPVPDLNYFYLDAEDGKIMLKWDTPPGRSYLRYIVFRNGQSIDTTTSNFDIDILENPGRYCYKVCSLSSDGFVSAPTEPVCLYYPFPPMVPVSNWALLLAGLLIGVYAFVMIRRR
jgi:hypothetical protein